MVSGRYSAVGGAVFGILPAILNLKLETWNHFSPIFVPLKLGN